MGSSLENLPTKKTLIAIAVTLLFGIIFFLFIQSTFHILRIQGESMKPGLESGDMILAVSQRSYNRFDRVVFKDPKTPKTNVVKRLIAFSGEHLSIRDGRLYIDNNALPLPTEDIGTSLQKDFSLLIPPGGCFVLGDNPYCSIDSRQFGPIPIHQIWARVLFKIWPFTFS